MVLVLKGLVSLHRTIQLQLLWHQWLGLDLDYCDIKWYSLEMNQDHSVIFEIASKYCISDSFFDHDGYFTSFFMIGDWDAEIGSQETSGVTGKFGLGSTE